MVTAETGYRSALACLALFSSLRSPRVRAEFLLFPPPRPPCQGLRCFSQTPRRLAWPSNLPPALWLARHLGGQLSARGWWLGGGLSAVT